MLQNLQNTLKEIKTLLLRDKVVRQLLYNDSNAALDMPAPDPKLVEEYLTLYPVYSFENCNQYEQNGMVNILLTEFNVDDEKKWLSTALQINVVFNVDRWMLLDDKIRPLALADRIQELINHRKFSAAVAPVLEHISDLAVNKKVVGYALLFALQDGSGEISKF